jgi:hypothetical protein
VISIPALTVRITTVISMPTSISAVMVIIALARIISMRTLLLLLLTGLL